MELLNVLVVEDEKIEREVLTKIICDNFRDCVGQVVSVTNGEVALEVFKKENFQLVFTDINTPKMTGLEFLREIKKINPEIKSIIVTGYDYFEYAQEAIRIGVDDFILKPATQEEICQRIKDIIGRMSQDIDHDFSHTSKFQEIQTILQSDLIYTILYHENAANIQKYLSIFHLEVKSAVCFCLNRNEVTSKQVLTIREELRTIYLSCFSENYFDSTVIYIFHDKQLVQSDIEMMKSQIKKVIGEYKTIRHGGIKNAIEEYYDSYAEARDQKEISINKKMQANCELQKEIQTLCNNLISSMMDGSLCADKQTVLEFRKLCLGMNKKQLQHALNIFLTILKDQMNANQDMKGYDEVIDRSVEQINNVLNILQAHELIAYTLKEITYPIVEKKRIKMNKLILKSYQYIENYYQRSIGLNDLANYLDVTPQYISSLLSKHAKNSFTNILAEYRISQAKLLLATDLKIKEIAGMVGFQNQNYFAKTFKKITGYTPNEYKIFYQIENDL